MSVLQPTPTTPTRPGLTQTQPSALTESQYVVNTARSFLGTPYVWGGDSRNGVDCSALLQLVWKSAGVDIPRTTYDQYQTGTPVSANNLRPGDAVFFRGSDPRGNLPGHVGIYIGNGKMIQAEQTGTNVMISTFSPTGDYVGARRYGDGNAPPAGGAPTGTGTPAGTPATSPLATQAQASTQALTALRALLATAPARVPTVNPGFTPLTTAAASTPAPVAAFSSPLLTGSFGAPLAALR